MPDVKSPRQLQIVDQVLTNVARQYRPQGFVYREVAPSIPVEAESGRFPVWSIQSFFGDASDDDQAGLVSDRAPTPEITFDWSEETYFCEDRRVKFTLTAKERRQGHQALRLERSKLTGLLDRTAIRRERRIAAELRQTGDGGQLSGGSATPSPKWDAANATIEADIKTGALAVRNKIGRLTNTAVLDLAVAAAVSLDATVREVLKYTIPGDRIIAAGGATILPPLIHGHRPLVTEAMRNTAAKDASASLSAIWDKEVRLVYLAPGGGGWGVPSVAYSFEVFGEQVDRWQDADPPVESVRAWEDVDEKVCAPDAGYSLKSVIS